MNTLPKRLAYICTDPGVPVFGTKGCSVHVQEVIRTFLKQGVHVTLFAQRIGGEAPADLVDVDVRKLPGLSKDSIADREKSALAVNDNLKWMLDTEGPFDIVYERYALWGYAGMAYAAQTGIAGMLEVNAPLIEEQRVHRTLIHEKEAHRVAQRAISNASALIAVSASVGDYLKQFPRAIGKIHVIPNGVDPDRFSPRRESRVKGDSFTVGFVGTLKPWHGVWDLIEAFSLLHRHAPQSRLLLVGDGPERDTLTARIAAHGLTLATRFTGAVHPEMVPELLRMMDVGVAPYPAMDNCYFSPMKAFEYMAAGIAFVGSNIGQLGKLVTHGEDGLLYKPGDTNQLAAHLIELFEHPERQIELGDAARETILRSYTWDQVGARILTIAGEQNLYEVA